jgi:hypothetical protein
LNKHVMDLFSTLFLEGLCVNWLRKSKWSYSDQSLWYGCDQIENMH